MIRLVTLDYTNCDRPGGGCSAMDIASGTFTAQTGGLYTVTFSGNADLISTDALPSTQYLSSSQRFRTERKSCFQRVSQREWMRGLKWKVLQDCGEHLNSVWCPFQIINFFLQIVSLAVGDTLMLQAKENGNDGLYILTICISLIAFPYGHWIGYKRNHNLCCFPLLALTVALYMHHILLT